MHASKLENYRSIIATSITALIIAGGVYYKERSDDTKQKITEIALIVANDEKNFAHMYHLPLSEISQRISDIYTPNTPAKEILKKLQKSQ